MKQARKFAVLSMAALVSLASFSACSQPSAEGSSGGTFSTSSASLPSSSQEAPKSTLNVATLKGPTGLGMVKLMADNKEGTTKNKYEFTMAGAPDEITAKLIKGELDVAAVPTNLAAVLYNKTEGNIQIAAINTLGVLSLVTNGEDIQSIADLKGKTIVATGQGSTPEFALNYILKQNGLEVGADVTVEYKSEHAELASLVVTGAAKIALLPEPFVTQVTAQNADVKIALDMTQEWNKATGNKSVLTMGCLVVRKDFAEKNKEAFNTFLNEYEASAKFTNENPAKAAQYSEENDLIKAAVAEKAIPNCNIVYLDGDEMKTKLPDFLQVLYEANPQSVGGKLPGEDFYYSK